MHLLQVALAVILVIFGVLLIVAAFIVLPTGVIDPTVLTAFGEILTFSGSLIGIDYHYRYKSSIINHSSKVMNWKSIALYILRIAEMVISGIAGGAVATNL